MFRRMGWWLEKVFGRWVTMVSLNKSCHEGVQSALSRRFMVKLESLLFDHVKRGPL